MANSTSASGSLDEQLKYGIDDKDSTLGKLGEGVKEILPLGIPLEEDHRPFWDKVFRPSRLDLDSIATQPSVFDDPTTLEVYRPPAAYENAHRFDPDARWTWREEKKIVRKVDLRIMLWACAMYLALDFDRGNISNANSDNFLDDLGLSTDDFNLGNSLFRLCFLIAELPSQLVSKRVGPDRWIPTQITVWSVVAVSQYRLSGRASFLATRCLLGFLQGGFIPDIVLYLSYFYTKRELPIRMAYFWVAGYITDIVSSFLATGILQMRGVAGQAGWRYLFLIEGCLTLTIGLLSFFLLPPGPTQTKAWFRPKGWFTVREETIIVNRVLRDDPSKSDMHNRQGLSMRQIFEALCDWRLWPIYALGITHQIPTGPPQVYLTLSLRNLGFTTTQTNLLTIPSTFIGLTTMILAAYFSEMVNSRVLATVLLQFWALPLLIALYTFTEQTSPWIYFAVVTLITGYPYVHPIQVAWASRNSNSVRARTISASCYNMFVQAGGIIIANIYRADDKVNKRGNRDLIAICCMNICLYAITFLFYRMLNNRRVRIWSSWTAEERKEYLENTKDKGNERMDFCFAS
ncbi:MFS general substrate transporter [Fomitiporia mediterranea MF3/22]|uniref:MFS general substrate transporter n=1 Tax=Fomitiporia mediterranea (strain MF3/22) TaxID=694068 RepID=UPI0004408E2F|nr:MFS general substrate transporter [Fomitiporia mediterranea MF3/22]EJD03747.1 MFS general substrate transporter [Fomitiporia mediterranea MF3/22]